MGLLSGLGRGLKGILGNDVLMNNLGAASAYLEGDYEKGAQIGGRSKELKKRMRARKTAVLEDESAAQTQTGNVPSEASAGFSSDLPENSWVFPDDMGEADERRGWGHGQAPFYGDSSPHRRNVDRAIPLRTAGQHAAIPSGTIYRVPDGSLWRKR